MVLSIASAFAGLLKVRLLHTTIDSHVFQLHYRWTTSFCFLASVLVATCAYIDSAIQCMDGSGQKVPDAVNTYCWILSTFTINSTSSETSNYGSRGSTFDGIGLFDPEIHTKTYHAYYQWVPFILFIQGCLFYLPHLLWKTSEGKTADNLLQGLQINSIDDDCDKKKENIVKYLRSSWGRNGRYSIVYMICESLNFLNVLSQIFLLDAFFGGVFLTFGTKVLEFVMNDDDDGRHDPLVTTFPRITKCTFKKYGPSGTIQTHDVACILPQNILNEKIFIAMWFWFVILATLSAMQIVWRFVLIFSPNIRLWVLEGRGKLTTSPKLEQDIRDLHLGDYFLLDTLRRNLDVYTFQDVLLKATDSYQKDVNKNSYQPFYEPSDDDDPLAMKRQMENEDATPV